MTPNQLADQIEKGTIGPDGLALIRSERRLIVEALRAYAPSHARDKCVMCGKLHSEPSASPDHCRDDHVPSPVALVAAPSTTPANGTPVTDAAAKPWATAYNAADDEVIPAALGRQFEIAVGVFKEELAKSQRELAEAGTKIDSANGRAEALAAKLEESRREYDEAASAVSATRRREIPAELYDGMAVYVALGVEKTEKIRPDMVSDVLDAVVRLIRKNASTDGKTPRG